MSPFHVLGVQDIGEVGFGDASENQISDGVRQKVVICRKFVFVE
ncbi:hypothetical protein [Halomonas sp. H10-59]